MLLYTVHISSIQQHSNLLPQAFQRSSFDNCFFFIYMLMNRGMLDFMSKPQTARPHVHWIY